MWLLKSYFVTLFKIFSSFLVLSYPKWMLSFLSTNPSDILVILVFCLFGLDIYVDIANMYCLHKEVDHSLLPMEYRFWIFYDKKWVLLPQDLIVIVPRRRWNETITLQISFKFHLTGWSLCLNSRKLWCSYYRPAAYMLVKLRGR